MGDVATCRLATRSLYLRGNHSTQISPFCFLITCTKEGDHVLSSRTYFLVFVANKSHWKAPWVTPWEWTKRPIALNFLVLTPTNERMNRAQCWWLWLGQGVTESEWVTAWNWIVCGDPGIFGPVLYIDIGWFLFKQGLPFAKIGLALNLQIKRHALRHFRKRLAAFSAGYELCALNCGTKLVTP